MRSVEEIKDRVAAIFDDLSRSPVPVSFGRSGSGVVTKGLMHNRFFRSLISPIHSFLTLAEDLHGIESHNTMILECIINTNTNFLYPCNHCPTALPGPSPSMADNQASYFAACGDADREVAFPEGSDSDDDFEEYYQNLTRKSAFGAPMFASHRLRCLSWHQHINNNTISPSSKPTHSFLSTFLSTFTNSSTTHPIETAHPLLLIDPTHDPVCPLSDAKLVQQKLKGAGLVEQRSYGRSSMSARAGCTEGVVGVPVGDRSDAGGAKICEIDEGEVPWGEEMEDNGL